MPVFIHDFLCLHPFNDGNGRMSRLFTTLLLYRNGSYVGKYIALEAKIAKNKDLYCEALRQAQLDWHEGNENVVQFIKYFLGVVLSAYGDFEDRFLIVADKVSAIEMVRRATLSIVGVYQAGYSYEMFVFEFKFGRRLSPKTDRAWRTEPRRFRQGKLLFRVK